MRAFGYKWAKAEYEWIRERMTDYNIGWISGYADRRASFLRNPEGRLGEIQLYLDEGWIYDGESSRYSWKTSGASEIQEKGGYMRWGIIGCLGREWDLVGEEEYQPPTKNERRSWKRAKTGNCCRRRCFRVPVLEHV